MASFFRLFEAHGSFSTQHGVLQTQGTMMTQQRDHGPTRSSRHHPTVITPSPAPCLAPPLHQPRPRGPEKPLTAPPARGPRSAPSVSFSMEEPWLCCGL